MSLYLAQLRAFGVLKKIKSKARMEEYITDKLNNFMREKTHNNKVILVTYVSSSNAGRDSKQIYDEMCECLVENFDNMNQLYGEKQVTVAMNINNEGKRIKPHVNDKVNCKTYTQFLKEESDYIESVFRESVANMKLLADDGEIF